LKATAQPGNWQNRLSKPVVPLSKIQSAMLRLLAAHRDPESYVVGATPLNRHTVRYSEYAPSFWVFNTASMPTSLRKPCTKEALKRMSCSVRSG
jgi:hypothetical protein